MAEFNFAEQVKQTEQKEKFNFAQPVKEETPEIEVSGKKIPFADSRDAQEIFRSLGLPENPTGDQIKEAISPRAKTERALIGFGRGVTDRLEGVQQLGIEASGLMKRLTMQEEFGTENEELTEFTERKLQDREEFAETPVGQSTAGQAGRVAGNVAPFFAIPGNPRTPFKIALYSAGLGGGEGATRFAERGENRVLNTLTGAQWGLGGGLSVMGAAKVVNLLRGAPGLVKQSDEVKSLLDKIKKARDSGLEIGPMSIDQATPENMILGRLGAQASSTSKRAQMLQAEQQASVVPALKSTKSADITKYKAGKVILSEADKAYKAELNKILNNLPRVSARQGGKALKEAVSDFSEKSRKHVSNLYSRVDEAAAKENPIYDMTYAKETSQDIKRLVLGDVELPSGQQAQVNVAATPEARLSRILDDVDRLKSTQTSYETIKALRSRTGELIESWPWEASMNKGQAKRLYKVLSDIMNNPLNKAPKTVAAHKEASSAARARYEALDAPAIRQIMKSDNMFELAEKFGRIGGLTDDAVNQINKWSPQKGETFKRYVRNNNILMSGDSSLDNIRNWRLKDPEMYRYVVPKNKEAELFKIATKLDELRNSNIGRVAKAQNKAKEAVNILIGDEATSQADVDFIIRSFGGPGSRGHKALRAGIFEDILDKATEQGKYGITLSKNKFSETIQKYERTGALNILTKQDRVKLKGLDSYLHLIMFRGKDPGVSLEAAQAITSLKHPATFMSGVHKLTFNSVLARMLMSERLGKVVLGSGKAKWVAPGNTAEKTGTILNVMLEDYNDDVEESQQ